MSRFRAGLGLANRFCEPLHVESARKLERVRDLEIPVKFLREVLPGRQEFLWITPEELLDGQDSGVYAWKGLNEILNERLQGSGALKRSGSSGRIRRGKSETGQAVNPVDM